MAKKNFSVVSQLIQKQQEEQEQKLEQQEVKEQTQPKQNKKNIKGYQLNIDKEQMEIIKIYAMFKQTTIKKVLEEALGDFIEKPSNKETIERCKELLKTLEKEER